jgi:hypothetical protein
MRPTRHNSDYQEQLDISTAAEVYGLSHWTLLNMNAFAMLEVNQHSTNVSTNVLAQIEVNRHLDLCKELLQDHLIYNSAHEFRRFCTSTIAAIVSRTNPLYFFTRYACH